MAYSTTRDAVINRTVGWESTLATELATTPTTLSAGERDALLVLARANRSTKVATIATMTDTATLTAANMLAGTIVATPTAAATYTLPTGAVLEAAMPAGVPVGFEFEFSITNVATNDTFDITVATAASGTTCKGNLTIEANSATTKIAAARFKVNRTASATFDVIRVS